MHPDHNAPPLNPLPAVVWALALPLIVIEIAVALGKAGIVGGPMAVGWRLQAMEYLAFSPDLMRRMVATGQYSLDGLHRLISYPLIHYNFMHALFALVLLLALGKMVGEVFRWWAVLIVFFGAAAVGALTYTFVLPAVEAPLIGGYPAVYGLIGAFTFLLWTNLARVGANRYRAFALIGFLLVIQLVFGVLFGGGPEWVADIAGFATGFLLSFVVSPGGFGRVVEKIRQR
ncbi:MAG: rhomboid family intramembrane serine protease [Tabrizicola sp.]|nr:rhomboid family intramembrane serine protease [Tabrizicola sp.]